MKVLYGFKEVEISDLPEGVYIPFSKKFRSPTAPLTERDKLEARIRQLGYDQDNGPVMVEGPFECLHLVKRN